MREEALKSFLEAVKADAGLQEQLKAAADDDSIVAIAKEAGFVIAAEELKKQADTEISDKELESVAGGNQSAVKMTTVIVCSALSELCGCI